MTEPGPRRSGDTAAWSVLAAAVLGVLVCYTVYLMLGSPDFRLLKTVTSPSQRFVLDHCRSNTDGNAAHHAPYGDHVFHRTSSPADDACTGDLVFSGYCQELRIAWPSPDRIAIECDGAEAMSTQMAQIRGAAVTLESTPYDVWSQRQ